MATTKLKVFFEPQQNRRYAVYRFRQAHQEAHETLDQFHTRLRTLAQTCSFNDVDFEIEQQIITAGLSSRIRKNALRDATYDLKSILNGQCDELSAYQACDIESKDERNKFNSDGVNQMASTMCRNCEGAWPHKGKCPAHSKQCCKCQKPNHLAQVCQGQLQCQNQPGRSMKHQHKRKQAPINPISKVDSDTDS